MDTLALGTVLPDYVQRMSTAGRVAAGQLLWLPALTAGAALVASSLSQAPNLALYGKGGGLTMHHLTLVPTLVTWSPAVSAAPLEHTAHLRGGDDLSGGWLHGVELWSYRNNTTVVKLRADAGQCGPCDTVWWPWRVW